MKFLVSLIILMSNLSMASEYEPFIFRCTYDATNDGLITTHSKIDPDNDAWTVEFKSSLDDEIDSIEAVSAYVYLKGEKTDTKTDRIIQTFVNKLPVDQSQWYTTTDITIFEGKPIEMRFFKFNSETKTLSVGIYTEQNGQESFTVCK